MKKSSFLFFVSLPFVVCFVLLLMLFSGTAQAQTVLAKWPLLQVKTGNAFASTTPLAGITTRPVNPSDTFNRLFSKVQPSSTGLKLKQGKAWPTYPNTLDSAHSLDFELFSLAGKDIIINGLTLDDVAPTVTGTATLSVKPYYQIDGVGEWKPLADQQIIPLTAAATINFGKLNIPFYLNSYLTTKQHTYKVRLCIYSTNGALKTEYFTLANVTFYGTVQAAAKVPTITTGTPSNVGKYAGIGTGKYDYDALNTYQSPTISGVTWNQNVNPSIATSDFTTDGANGVINSINATNIKGLTAGKTYHIRAYLVTPIDTIYGNDLIFNTDPTEPPKDSTIKATNVGSNRATVGGVIVDSGGLSIKYEYIKYGTDKTLATFSTATPNPNPAIGTSYSVRLSLLKPNTQYYYQACAKNGTGTSCGNIESFTTSAPVPSLTAIPNMQDFGNIIYGSKAPIVSYTLTSDNFPASGGTVTVGLSSTTGYVISFSSNFSSNPGNSINYSFKGTHFTKTVYVKFLTGNYGSFPATITHSCSLVDPSDADVFNISGNIIPSPDKLSNMGTDFWTGFGYEEKMSRNAGDAAEAKMSIYVSTGNQEATVHVELPNAGYSKSFPIPANSVHEFTDFPTGDPKSNTNDAGLPDSRLYKTGVSNKAIHIYSDNSVPVAAFLHTYTTSNSAAGAMLFPSNTWNSAYTVQAYGGTTNNSNPNSFFFVIAKDDNTEVSFWPTQPILDSSTTSLFNSKPTTASNTAYSPRSEKTDAPYKIVLNKGQVFNAMGGFAAGDVGLDLSGTIVKTSCDKKIAVFGGFGRGFVNPTGCSANSGSDHLIQQMFPSVAWGTKYLTYSTKTEITNYYRIYISDASTSVKVNKVKLGASNFTSGIFYEYESTQPLLIEGDKPISVCQFITTPSCNAPAVNGGPEMMILSPIQQSITSATVYSAPFKTTGNIPALANGTIGNCASYINVIIPNSGVAGFTLDGKNTADIGVATVACSTKDNSSCASFSASNKPVPMATAFKHHPQDTNYSVATFWVTTAATHTLSSTVGFNAVAYGLGVGESYGYNAGTAINNLSSVKVIRNPHGTDTSSSVVHTCKNNAVSLQIALPYLPSQVDSIVWSTPTNANISPSDTVFTGPISSSKYADTSGVIVVNGQTFYVYTCPVGMSFSDNGFYPITATAHGTFASDCAGIDAQTIYVQVSSDNINFTAVPAGCGKPEVLFTDSSSSTDGSIVKWIWDFRDGTKDSSINPVSPNPTLNPHKYPSLNQYTPTLTTINSVGCSSIDSVSFDLSLSLKAKFVKDLDTICTNAAVSFTDSSVNAASWKWDFGETTSSDNTSTLQNPTHTYTTSGKHIITLQVFTAGTPTCASNVFTDSVYVSTLPKPNFTFGGVCLPGSTVFTNTSDAATGFAPYKYSWDFGEPTSGLNNSATTTDGTHTYTPPKPSAGYTVKLTATNRFGCSADVSQNVNTVYEKPTAIITPVTNNICFGDSTVFTDASTAANGQKIVKWNWDFADAPTDTVQNPKHKFSAVNAYTVKLSVITDQGCKADTFTVVKISPIPVAGFRLPSSCLGGGNVTFTDTSTITDASLMPFKFAWNFGDAASNANNVSADQNAQHDYTAAGVGSYTVAETVSASNGCKATSTRIFEIAGSKPIPSFEIVGTSICSNLPIQIKDTSRIALGTIKKVEIVWDVVGKPTVVEVDSVSPSNGATGKFKIYTHKYPELSADKSYTIKLTAYSGTTCFDVYSQTITVHGTPVVTFANQVFICANASPRDFIPAKETSGLAGAFTYSGAGVSGVSFNPKKAAVGKDSITAIYTTTDGCKDTAYSVIQVMDTIGVTLNPRTINMCKKDSIQLTPISKAGEYAWSETDVPNNTFVNGITNTKSVWVKPTGNITQYVVVANASNCPTTDTVTIYAARYPSVIITSPRNKETTICYGADTKLTVNTISPNITWTPVDSISGSNTLKSIVVNPRDTTKFVVTVSDNSYCTKSVSDTVTVNVLPNFAIGIHVGSDTSTRLTPGDSLIMLAYVTDTAYKAHLDYSWFPITYLNDPDTSRPILLPVLPLPNPTKTTYTVTATNAAKCKAKASIDIDFYRTQPDILVPTAFSPNGDGKNDKLIPFPIGITHFGFFRVFNRSGQLVFSTNQIGVGWDGTIQGQPADPGTYIWMTDGVDYKGKAHPHGGSVVLLR